MIASELKVVAEFRHFERATSELESRLRIYPDGLTGEYLELAPNQADYEEDQETGAVRKLSLTYTLPESVKVKITDRSDIMFLSHLRFGRFGEGDELVRFTPMDAADGTMRYLAVREPGSLTLSTFSASPSVELLGQAMSQDSMPSNNSEQSNYPEWMPSLSICSNLISGR